MAPKRGKARAKGVRPDEPRGFELLIGHSRAIARVIEQAHHIASTRSTVLIEGEAGTGKRTLARAIHQNGPRRNAPFVALRLGALGASEIESELFGREREARAGGAAVQRGRFEIADRGTLYLDEIGAAPPAVQVQLLRAIQDHTFVRPGGADALKTDVRLIAGTERDLAADVRSGRFRAELHERLGSVRVRIPPLRERREDVPLLVESFLRDLNREHGRRVAGITPGALERLTRYAWPGNVTELRNAVEGMVVCARGRRPLDLSDLPAWLRSTEAPEPRLEVAVGMTVDEAERQLIAATLRQTGNDKPRAAAMLGIGLRTLYRKIQRHRIR